MKWNVYTQPCTRGVRGSCDGRKNACDLREGTTFNEEEEEDKNIKDDKESSVAGNFKKGKKN